MSQQIVFADGTIIPIVMAVGERKSYPLISGKRDYIDFYVEPTESVSLDALDALTAEGGGNTSKITLVTDEMVTAIDGVERPVHTETLLEHYTLRVDFGKVKTLLSEETATSPAVYQERVHVVLAQLTYAEVQQAAQAATIDALGQQIVALTLGGAI
ncbi:hypothetical protein [Faecalispora anaeroviscerum]|uniref:hypothetical protein n=1 Tax=Faecalispora anaeroviscerum TaxID=2991836 RepID=UPI0024BB28E8|nr:hypothetical protein [Faecalispora anaeroviscerum]